MASNLAVRFYPEIIRRLAGASVVAGYTPIGVIPSAAGPTNNQYSFLNPERLMIIQNLTPIVLTYSWDGINDHLDLPAGGQVIFDITANRTDSGGSFNAPQGQIIYVKGAATTGTANVSVFYGVGSNA